MQVVVRCGGELEFSFDCGGEVVVDDEVTVGVDEFEAGGEVHAFVVAFGGVACDDPSADVADVKDFGLGFAIRIELAVFIEYKRAVAVSAYHDLSGRHIPFRVDLEALNAASHVAEDLIK
ncbi:hypothetical protein D6853_05855 [Butyrivibrio sp. X503]|nr:hypothetical protein D6853_05855 [Butyrivibrio sp. X503]